MPSAVVDDTIAEAASTSAPSDPPNTPKPTPVLPQLSVAAPSQPPTEHQLPADASTNNLLGETALDIGGDDVALSDVQNQDAPPAMPSLPPVDETVAATELLFGLDVSVSTDDSDGEEDASNPADGLSPSAPSNPRPGSDVDWRTRAKNADWTCQKSIKAQFPLYKDRKKYGQLQVPLKMIEQYGSCYQKAKAVAYFRRLTPLQQKHLTAHYKKLAAQEKKAQKEAQKARKKVEDQILRDRRKRLKKEQQAAARAAKKAEKRALKEAEKPEKDAARKAKKKKHNDKRKSSDEAEAKMVCEHLMTSK